jgi:hypothetical protein
MPKKRTDTLAVHGKSRPKTGRQSGMYGVSALSPSQAKRHSATRPNAPGHTRLAVVHCSGISFHSCASLAFLKTRLKLLPDTTFVILETLCCANLQSSPTRVNFASCARSTLGTLWHGLQPPKTLQRVLLKCQTSWPTRRSLRKLRVGSPPDIRRPSYILLGFSI